VAPTLIASYPLVTSAVDSSTLTTPSFTPANGEVIVVKGATWDSTQTMSTPTGGSQTYTLRASATSGGFRPWVGIWTAVVSGSPGSMTISSTPSANSWHNMVVERWSSAQLATTPVTNSAQGGTGAASSTLTTSAANSVISWLAGDAQSLNPSTRAYLGSATEELVDDQHASTNGVWYYARQAVASAGSTSYGLTAPTGMQFWIAGVEILDAASGTSYTRAADDVTGLSDQPAAALAYARLTSDLVGPSDAVATATAYARASIDLTGLTDSVSVALGRAASVTDDIGPSDLAGTVAAYGRAAADLLGLTDAAFTAVAFARVVIDDTGLTDSVAVQSSNGLTRATDDTLGLIDQVAILRAVTAADAAALTDTVAQNRAVTAADDAGLADAVAAVVAGAGTRQIDDPIGLTDAISYASTATVNDPLGLSDVTTLAIAAARAATEALGLADAVTAALGHTVAVTDSLGFTDVADSAVSTGGTHIRTVDDPIGLAAQHQAVLTTHRSAGQITTRPSTGTTTRPSTGVTQRPPFVDG
jgi:hypothetical protein